MRNSFILMVLLAVLAGCDAISTKTLFTLGEVKKVDDDKAALVLIAETQINPELLVPGKSVKINFPVPDKIIALDLKPVTAESLGLPKGQSAWVGQLEGGNDIFIMRIGNSIEAKIHLGNFIYRLRSKTAKAGVLEVFDDRKFREAPNDGIIDPNVTGKNDGQSGDSSCLDPANRIDVMMLYTTTARDAAGGAAQIENQIAFAVGYTNLAYANSSVTHRLNLIYTGLASYNEPAAGVDSNALLGDFAGTSDGVLDTIHGLRDSAQADLVSLIYEVDDSSWCGWGQTQETANADTTDHRAFTVVKRSCTGTTLSYAHEVGHNMGALHDRANATAGVHTYNFGHIQPVPSLATTNPWRSVMSYNGPCKDSSATGSCPRVPWFSNPNVTRLGDVTGVPLTSTDPEHNVMVHALNDGEVSRYRCLRDSTTGANVWMKDRWEDEGNEPDPATVGKAMWQSPYIWVRLSEDTTLEHEHEHENPRQDQTNFVYVKLHNTGGASESSDLELYFASASTNLNNPANWTLIGSQPRTITAGVDVAKFDWSALPGSGHYCLLARWNTGGTPLAFTDVGAAVRASNDLIWRNVDVIGLGSPDSSADFEMAGDRESRETYLLITTKPMSHRKIDWAKLATASIKINPTVIDEKKLRVTGLKEIDKGSFELPLGDEVKLIGPFTLKYLEKTKVRLAIKADLAAVKQASAQLANPAHYDISVMQIRAKGVPLALENPAALFEKQGLVIGGVSYTLQVPANQ